MPRKRTALANTPAREVPQDKVELADIGSFPASDAPPWTLGVKKPGYRLETDSMGEVRVPSEALYGAQTQRAFNNFAPTGYRLQPEFVKALGLIKSCCAKANCKVGVLPLERADAIASAANAIAQGRHYEQFVVDVFQTGSGTSTNMNANEVIAKLSGAHPNDHVNRSQSSNDVIPAAIHIAAAVMIHQQLLPASRLLSESLDAKTKLFWDVVKIGRTHLQDATPIRLGQEFSGYAQQVKACEERVTSALNGIYELPLGGTAVGTGVNAPTGFAALAIQFIAERTNLPFREARNHFEAQAAKDAVLFLSGALRTCAVALTKIANDLRWLSSGPRAGLAEIRLPELQPGSSIMPGKVNPVIPESVLMICAQVIGHDTAMSWACAGGNFELNTMMPLIAYNLLDCIILLSAGMKNLAEKCVNGLEANSEAMESLVERSLAMATALTPEIGYDRAAAIAKEAFERGETVRETALRVSGLSAKRIDELLKFA